MDALEALEQFKSTGETKQVRVFKATPALKFSTTGGEFVTGKYVALKDRETKAGKSIIELDLIDTNAVFTVKDDESYKPVAVKAGDRVAIFAPAALDRVIRNTSIGSDVYIRCDGKVKGIRNGKSSEFYKFDVRTK